jgi:hypothetical protein
MNWPGTKRPQVLPRGLFYELKLLYLFFLGLIYNFYHLVNFPGRGRGS